MNGFSDKSPVVRELRKFGEGAVKADPKGVASNGALLSLCVLWLGGPSSAKTTAF
jgi:hypothetical protein